MNMKPKLPDDFVSRMEGQLGSELPAFLHALEEEPVRGIRLNRLKTAEGTEKFRQGPKIPWADEA